MHPFLLDIILIPIQPNYFLIKINHDKDILYTGVQYAGIVIQISTELRNDNAHDLVVFT